MPSNIITDNDEEFRDPRSIKFRNQIGRKRLKPNQAGMLVQQMEGTQAAAAAAAAATTTGLLALSSLQVERLHGGSGGECFVYLCPFQPEEQKQVH